MENLEKDKVSIQKELSELLNQYYDGSFSRMVGEYIRTTKMTKEERETLWKTIKEEVFLFSLQEDENPH